MIKHIFKKKYIGEKLKKWIFILSVLLWSTTVHAEEEPVNLHAQSAVLMDAESGRVLFEKNGYDIKAMASTTKIMTCIVALEKQSGRNSLCYRRRT